MIQSIYLIARGVQMIQGIYIYYCKRCIDDPKYIYACISYLIFIARGVQIIQNIYLVSYYYYNYKRCINDSRQDDSR